ncbi:pro-sigmaK processing inhibitor BofA family protein [Sporosarcina sp. HYO08]|uniref:pro-sigmaK processing inhibitor BofA family protein n=1 Tax=Sporosarcina sp. HYO08 TaxID=1759557 RepID=UPI0020A51247|nr:pro-sigmaK processing inhibitor BofA family protein [Sporosarcina sp. HYO08]
MKIIMILSVGVFLLLLLMLDKKQIQKGLELLSIFWFRLAFAFLALFAMNVVGGFIGIYVPINIASGLILTILGIPGFAALCTFAVFL